MAADKEVSTEVVSASTSQENIDREHEVKTTSWWRHILGYVWESAEGDPKNRKYVQKIDAYML